MSRQCGPCTMCCKVMGVVELKKAPAKWCEHCAVGKGCKIYEEQPETCKEFECLWLYDEQWPEGVRPDRSHVVMSSTLDEKRLVANVDPSYPNAFQEGQIGKILSGLVKHVDVIVVIGDKRKIMTIPEREVAVREIITQ